MNDFIILIKKVRLMEIMGWKPEPIVKHIELKESEWLYSVLKEKRSQELV